MTIQCLCTRALQFNHFGIYAALCFEFLRRALLCNFTALQNDYLFRPVYRSHTVRYDKHSLVLYECGQCSLYFRFVFGIGERRRFVEYDNRRVFQLE